MNNNITVNLFTLFLLALSPLVLANNSIPDYPAERISDNTWVIHGPLTTPNPENKGFMNNPTFVVTDKSVVVFDSGSTLETGRMVLRQISKVTDKPVSHVFASHIHGDHWLANQAIKEKFPQALFYGHPQLILEANSGEAKRWLALMEKETKGASKGTLAVIPDQALSDGQVIKVNNITFKVYLSEQAHTKTDAMIQVVEESVLITGDNALFKRIGGMTEGSFKGNIAACELAVSLQLKHYVPGHGPSGGVEVIQPYCHYLSDLYSTVATLYEDDLSDFEMKDTVVKKLSPIADWVGFTDGIGKLISLAVLEVEQAEFE